MARNGLGTLVIVVAALPAVVRAEDAAKRSPVRSLMLVARTGSGSLEERLEYDARGRTLTATRVSQKAAEPRVVRRALEAAGVRAIESGLATADVASLPKPPALDPEERVFELVVTREDGTTERLVANVSYYAKNAARLRPLVDALEHVRSGDAPVQAPLSQQGAALLERGSAAVSRIVANAVGAVPAIRFSVEQGTEDSSVLKLGPDGTVTVEKRDPRGSYVLEGAATASELAAVRAALEQAELASLRSRAPAADAPFRLSLETAGAGERGTIAGDLDTFSQPRLARVASALTAIERRLAVEGTKTQETDAGGVGPGPVLLRPGRVSSVDLTAYVGSSAVDRIVYDGANREAVVTRRSAERGDVERIYRGPVTREEAAAIEAGVKTADLGTLPAPGARDPAETRLVLDVARVGGEASHLDADLSYYVANRDRLKGLALTLDAIARRVAAADERYSPLGPAPAPAQEAKPVLPSKGIARKLDEAGKK